MNVLHVDVIGGAAGDMLLAALLDVGASRQAVEDAATSVLGRRIELTTADVGRGGVRALALSVREGDISPRVRPRGPSDLIEMVERAELPEAVRSRSLAVLMRLGNVEARVHGVELDDLELDELGEDDTLIDVVGVVAALESLDVGRVSVSSVPLPLTMPPAVAPGTHPFPAPATLELLRGFSIRSLPAGAASIETVTPTGAAILATLGEPSADVPELTLRGVGYGAGTNDPSGFANVVRVLLGSPASVHTTRSRRLLVVEANVDDLSPELLPDAVEALVGAGALDAWTTPIVMKHGRAAVTISALCDGSSYQDVRDALFESTSTFGVRVHEVDRPELERRTVEVELAAAGPRIRVKIGFLDGRPVSAKPEHADVVEAARKLDRPVRSVHEQATALARDLLENEQAR